MKKHILIYGLCGGVLIVILKLVEYRFLVIQHSIEIYGGLIALVFAVLGSDSSSLRTRKRSSLGRCRRRSSLL
jgi:NarL family two-component system response regulator LiaR